MKGSDLHKENRNRKILLVNQPNYLLIFVISLFSLILGRVFWLQIIKGSFFRKLSDENRIRLVSSPPIRGRILDMKGRILADNKLTHSLILQPHLISNKQWDSYYNALGNLLEIDNQTLNTTYKIGIENKDFIITLLRNMSTRQVVRFKEQEAQYKGIQIHVELVRFYPNKTLASHVLGYTQFINQEEYQRLRKYGYSNK